MMFIDWRLSMLRVSVLPKLIHDKEWQAMVHGPSQPIPDFVSRFYWNKPIPIIHRFSSFCEYICVYVRVCVYIGVAVGTGLQCQQAVDVGHLRGQEVRDFEER